MGVQQYCNPYEQGAPEFLLPISVHWALSGVTKYKNLLYYSVKREKNPTNATIRCLLSTSVSISFGPHYVHLHENKDRVTAFGVLLWFC